MVRHSSCTEEEFHGKEANSYPARHFTMVSSALRGVYFVGMHIRMWFSKHGG
jgi:hypothetical protein